MLTNNLRKFLNMSPGKNTVNATDYKGAAWNWRDYHNYYTFTGTNLLPSTDSQSVCVGSGGGAESPESYTLEQMIETGITTNCSFTRNGFKTTFSKLVTNISDQDIIIREIGYFTGRSDSAILLDRTVLKEPVVIKPNESKTIQYTIDYSNI